uniref:Uncharacterized protein n=1 Tax=Medicago truncatula TaxID=3880 RepID=A4PSF4_MEDTR|nr:hypothetical protein MtrDRAFT_AC140551g57v2 [Medicago truncatula]
MFNDAMSVITRPSLSRKKEQILLSPFSLPHAFPLFSNPSKSCSSHDPCPNKVSSRSKKYWKLGFKCWIIPFLI